MRNIIMHYQNKDLKNIDGEVWADAFGLDGIYEVSSFGRVKRLKRTITFLDGRVYTFPEIIASQIKIKHPFTTEKGDVVYDKNFSLYVRLTIDKNVCKTFSVGGLILNSFKKPDKYNDKTHHINGISYDNRLENLAFEDLSTSRKIQFDKGIRNGKKQTKHWVESGVIEKNSKDFNERVRPLALNAKKPLRFEQRNRKPITIYFVSKNEVFTYTSIRNASEQTGIKEITIRNAIARPHKNRKIVVKYGVFNIKNFGV